MIATPTASAISSRLAPASSESWTWWLLFLLSIASAEDYARTDRCIPLFPEIAERYAENPLFTEDDFGFDLASLPVTQIERHRSIPWTSAKRIVEPHHQREAAEESQRRR
jgi:hypothetical protein